MKSRIFHEIEEIARNANLDAGEEILLTGEGYFVDYAHRLVTPFSVLKALRTMQTAISRINSYMGPLKNEVGIDD